MSASETRQTINQYLDQLSSESLSLVADFIIFLAQQEQKEKPTLDIEGQPQPTQGSLLSHTETWEGDDFEECLQTVYETRSQIQA